MEQLLEHGPQAGAEVGELVDRRGGRGREAPLGDQAGGFKRAQALGEDVRADAREARLEVGVALGAQEEIADDEQRPALADDVERAGRGAELLVAAHTTRISAV